MRYGNDASSLGTNAWVGWRQILRKANSANDVVVPRVVAPRATFRQGAHSLAGWDYSSRWSIILLASTCDHLHCDQCALALALRHVSQSHETECALPDLPDKSTRQLLFVCRMHNSPGVIRFLLRCRCGCCDSDNRTFSNEVDEAMRTS